MSGVCALRNTRWCLSRLPSSTSLPATMFSLKQSPARSNFLKHATVARELCLARWLTPPIPTESLRRRRHRLSPHHFHDFFASRQSHEAKSSSILILSAWRQGGSKADKGAKQCKNECR